MSENAGSRPDREDETTTRLAILAAAALNRREEDNTTPPSRGGSGQLPGPPSTTRRAYNEPDLPPPPTSYLFTWWCHECGSGYPLVATRRCLKCGHQFCRAPVRSRRGEGKGPCSAEFDYRGWAVWGAYRRSVAAARATREDDAIDVMEAQGSAGGKKKQTSSCDTDRDTFAKWELITHNLKKRRKYGRNRPLSSRTSEWRPLPQEECDEVSRRKEAMYIRGRHNCWRHCDFPSECLHTIHDACVSGKIRTSRGSSGVSSTSSSCETSSQQEEGRESEREREDSRVQKAAPGLRRRSARVVNKSKLGNQTETEDGDDDCGSETSDWLLSSSGSDSSESLNDSDPDAYDDDSLSS